MLLQLTFNVYGISRYCKYVCVWRISWFVRFFFVCVLGVLDLVQ